MYMSVRFCSSSSFSARSGAVVLLVDQYIQSQTSICLQMNQTVDQDGSGSVTVDDEEAGGRVLLAEGVERARVDLVELELDPDCRRGVAWEIWATSSSPACLSVW